MVKHRMNTFILSTAAFLTAVAEIAALDCDADWIVDPASGHCYKGFNSPVTLWSDARSRCQQHGADLASITSNREKEFIAELLADIDAFATWWIGLTKDLNAGGKWVWTTGEPLSDEVVVNNGLAEPNNPAVEGCGDLELFSAFSVTVWNTACSSADTRYVCEISHSPTVSSTTKSATTMTSTPSIHSTTMGVFSTGISSTLTGSTTTLVSRTASTDSTTTIISNKLTSESSSVSSTATSAGATTPTTTSDPSTMTSPPTSFRTTTSDTSRVAMSNRRTPSTIPMTTSVLSTVTRTRSTIPTTSNVSSTAASTRLTTPTTTSVSSTAASTRLITPTTSSVSSTAASTRLTTPTTTSVSSTAASTRLTTHTTSSVSSTAASTRLTTPTTTNVSSTAASTRLTTPTTTSVSSTAASTRLTTSTTSSVSSTAASTRLTTPTTTSVSSTAASTRLTTPTTTSVSSTAASTRLTTPTTSDLSSTTTSAPLRSSTTTYNQPIIIYSVVTVYDNEISGRCLAPLYIHGNSVAPEDTTTCSMTTSPLSYMFDIEEDANRTDYDHCVRLKECPAPNCLDHTNVSDYFITVTCTGITGLTETINIKVVVSESTVRTTEPTSFPSTSEATSDATTTSSTLSQSALQSSQTEQTICQTISSSSPANSEENVGDIKYILAILSGGVALIVITVALTACLILKSKHRDTIHMKAALGNDREFPVTAGTPSVQAVFPDPPARVQTNLFELNDELIVPPHYSQTTVMAPWKAATLTDIGDNVLADKPKFPDPPTRVESKLFEAYDGPGIFVPPHQIQIAAKKVRFTDVDV